MHDRVIYVCASPEGRRQFVKKASCQGDTQSRLTQRVLFSVFLQHGGLLSTGALSRVVSHAIALVAVPVVESGFRCWDSPPLRAGSGRGDLLHLGSLLKEEEDRDGQGWGHGGMTLF